jgi:predicted nucleic acid-binding protein
VRFCLDTNVLVSAYIARLGFCAKLIDELKPAADEPLIVMRTHHCSY